MEEEMTKQAQNTYKKLLLRLSSKAYKMVKKRAQDNKRSLNSQIVFELEQK